MNETEFTRPNWNEHFLEFAVLASNRSNCIKRKVGAVITESNIIISTGMNGTPSGIINCYQGGCKRCNSNIKSGEQLENCVCLHAEENAILHARQDLSKCTLYCTHKPCLGCLKRIIQVGIKTVYYKLDYPVSDIYSDLVQQSRINLIQMGHL